ncbi:MAG: Gfo/Idh/MocA family oxidoreductase [Candidatus Solibacter usitatus]|nr:Gfo/Idh/MocA family oxidoreductase [Candidatus Solibacter usitatus]
MDRRTVLTTALSAAAYQRVSGANDRIRLGIIGSGGRGRYVGGFMKTAPDVEFVAAADVSIPIAERAAQALGGPNATVFQDFRKLLERKDIDAVLVATPDHWHAMATVLAIRAGKHVYVEKPLAHNVKEGRAMVDAAKRTKLIVQCGTQQRSAPHFKEVAGLIRNGEVGNVHFVRVWNYNNISPSGIGKVPDSAPPAGLDWDMYCGPAPLVPYNSKRHVATFRSFTDYAGGTITDYGTHRFDTVHQIMGVDAPKSVTAAGGRFELRDAGDVPDLIQVTYEYPGFVMSYEACNFSAHGLGGRTPGMKYYNARHLEDRPNGMAFYGTKGALFTDRVGYEIYPDLKPGSSSEFRAQRTWKNTTDATSLHAVNFIAAIRGQAPSACPIETGHKSTLIAHLGNIALRTGKKLSWDASKETFPGEDGANKLLGRKARAPWNLIG